MTATLTINLDPEVLKALRDAKSITVEVGSAGGAGRAPRAEAAPRAANGKAGPYRAGSLPARLVAWAGTRKRPFGVPDLMRKFKIKRGHASMLIAYVQKSRAVRRVGRGEYVTP